MPHPLVQSLMIDIFAIRNFEVKIHSAVPEMINCFPPSFLGVFSPFDLVIFYQICTNFDWTFAKKYPCIRTAPNNLTIS